jgi:hypothetical protein
MKPPSPGSVSNFLSGVAVTSAANAWAVGSYSNVGVGKEKGQTLIVRWNGTRWKQQSSPNPGSGLNELSGVAATSATNAWAVGRYDNGVGTFSRTLIEHWDGSSWKQVPSPTPGRGRGLNGIAAVSATDAWAVGAYGSNTTHRETTLIEHWDGRTWRRVHSPNPGSPINDNELDGVAATSASDAWAVGSSGPYEDSKAVIEHWDGSAWKRVLNFSFNSNTLSGVAATSSANAWAVGSTCMMCGSEAESIGPLIEHWNGTRWKQQPNPTGTNLGERLSGVTSTSATNAWTAGGPLIARWNGTSWKQQPNPKQPDSLSGVAAISATSAWAVGGYRHGRISHTLALRGC